jgi:hypothetical protein
MGGSGVTGVGPKSFCPNAEGCEEYREEGKWEIFDGPEMAGGGCAFPYKADEKKDVRECGESEDDPEVEVQVMVERGAVRAGVGWEEGR